MILLKMNIKTKEIKEIYINKNKVNILFNSIYGNNENRNYPLFLETTTKQIKTIYNKIRNYEKKLKKKKL